MVIRDDKDGLNLNHINLNNGLWSSSDRTGGRGRSTGSTAFTCKVL